ncbi:MAG: hypothetical protein N2485_08510, partial [bacterium]|nr:hypothetical protein [bacterium]
MSIVFYLKDIDLLQQLIQKGYRIKPDMLNRFFNIFKEVPIEDIENDKHFIKQVLNIVSKYNIQIIDENLVKIFSQLNVELVKDIIPDLIKLY